MCVCSFDVEDAEFDSKERVVHRVIKKKETMSVAKIDRFRYSCSRTM